VLVAVFRVGRTIDPEFCDESLCHRTIGGRTLDGEGSAKTKAKGIAYAKLIALGMTAEIIVIVENQDSSVGICFTKEMSGCKSADTASHDDQVVGFLGIFWFSGGIPERAIAQTVRGLKRSRMTSPHARKSRRIVNPRLVCISR